MGTTRVIAGLGPTVAFVAAFSFAADTDWPSYGNDAASTKYAPLDQVHAGNVDQLEVAWTWESPDNARGLFPGPFKSTPIKIGDVLYVSTSLGQVAALDAATGRQRWVFDTGSWRRGTPANLGFNHRGVAYWADGDRRRILMPTNDGHLWSLYADTGRPDPDFGNDGRIDLKQGLGRPVERDMYSMISPPLVVDDLAIVGSVVADHWSTRRLTDYPPGDVRAFDVRTGELRWRFRSIPRPGEPGNETWLDGSWEVGGAVNVWTLMSADHDLGYVYLPFGTPSNDWYGGHRPGDNLFGESLVCLEAATGKLVWHFQTVHHGLWDYDLPAAPNLVDITIDGRAIKAVAQVTKQGFVFVLDRVTGEPVWPIEERAVPADPDTRGAHVADPAPPVPTGAVRAPGHFGGQPDRLFGRAAHRDAGDHQQVRPRPALHAAQSQGDDPAAGRRRGRRMVGSGVRPGDRPALHPLAVPRHPREARAKRSGFAASLPAHGPDLDRRARATAPDQAAPRPGQRTRSQHGRLRLGGAERRRPAPIRDRPRRTGTPDPSAPRCCRFRS